MLDIPFKVMIPNIDESMDESENIFFDKSRIPEILARKKVEAIISSIPKEQEIQWILGADTLIYLNDEIIGKPQNPDEAFEILNKLQGKTHTVKTGLVLYNGKNKTFSSSLNETQVTFSNMNEEEINWYVETGEWHGAAGGYRIQGVASCFIKNVNGSYSGVVGLPISELYDILKCQNYQFLK